MTDATVAHRSIGPAARAQAVIDTGSLFIIAPIAMATAIWGAVDGAFPVVKKRTAPRPTGAPPSQTQFHAYPCDMDPRIALVLGDHELGLNALDLNLGRLSDRGVLLDDRGNESLMAFEDLPGARDKPLEAAQRGSTPFCVATLVGQRDRAMANTVICGSPLLKSWYTTFDMDPERPSIGFAAARGGDGGVDGSGVISTA